MDTKAGDFTRVGSILVTYYVLGTHPHKKTQIEVWVFIEIVGINTPLFPL